MQHRSVFAKLHKPFLSFFLQLYCPIGISPVGNLSCFPRGKPAATESRYPTYGLCWVLQCFHNPLKSDKDYRIFKEHTDVNACDCTWGCMDHTGEFALKVDSGKKIKPASVACRSDTLPTELHPHHLL